MENKYKSMLDVLVVFELGGRRRRRVEITYGKPVRNWDYEDYRKIEKWILKNGITGQKVDDVSIIIARDKEENGLE